VSPLDAATRRLMTGRAWRPGCPVALRDLRQIRLTYWGFDHRVHRGRLVVRDWFADEVVRVFHRLYDVRYPIRSMRLVDHYGADDMRSMTADNTSAFNCRWRAGICCTWSQHAYGRALDLNPVENPFMFQGGFSPANARPFLDRSQHRRGMIHRRDSVSWAFRAVGWTWGGDWAGAKDYQHFSSNGR
jgi:D-alanyl-D-alanine carboxypeptidase